MNITHTVIVLFFVLTMGAALIDMVWRSAPMRGKWPFPTPKYTKSRVRDAENALRVLMAQARRNFDKK